MLPKLPPRIVDSHHHILNSDNTFSTFLHSLTGPGRKYLPSDYHNDVTEPLTAADITLSGTIHMETVPDVPYGGVEEVAWIQSYIEAGELPHMKAIVGSCDIGDPATVKTCLEQMKAASPLVRGVRWIADHVGTYDGTSATHVATQRHDIDYLRGGQPGDASSSVVPSFEDGLALLGEYGWSFDLQCAPVQLCAAAEMIGRHPEVPVVIDHLGKPRLLLGPTSDDTEVNTEAIEEWRIGMRAMASLPNTYVKISMLGYICPDWIVKPAAEAVLRDLVRETLEMFGPQRVMMALNWYVDAKTSDGDGFDSVGPSPVEFCERVSEWLKDYSDEDREWVFAKCAERFYKL